MLGVLILFLFCPTFTDFQSKGSKPTNKNKRPNIIHVTKGMM